MKIALLAVICLAVPSFAQKQPRSFELQASSPQFWELVDHDSKLETVATGFGFTEGPMWDAAGFLYVSDETINKIFKVFPDGKKEEVIALGDPDGNTFDRQHRLIDCASVLRAIIEVPPDGKHKILADHYDGKKFNSPNDVVVRHNGEIYCIDWHDQNPCHQTKPDDWDYEHGRVYRIQPKGLKTKKAEDLGKKTIDELTMLFDNPNPYCFRTAMRLLAERFFHVIEMGS